MAESTSVDLGGFAWTLADPYDTQAVDDLQVPPSRGIYLWLRRARPGMGPGATEDVLYVGRSKNLRERLHLYSAVTYKKEEPVLRAVFDRVIAPHLGPEQLKRAVVDRTAPGLAQMWVRDHVVFAWMLWDQSGIGSLENQLRGTLRPWFNGIDKQWTKYETTCHEDHDLTLPILPTPHWT